MAEPGAASTAGGRRLESLHGRILGQIDELLAVARDPGSFPEARTAVSRWSALDHAEHIAKVDEGSLRQLETALGRDGGPGLKFVGRLVLWLGWIPRGVGKAPGNMRPADRDRDEAERPTPSRDDDRRRAVAEHLTEVRGAIEALAGRFDEIAAGRGRAGHHVFGGLTPGRWFRFLWVHHRHHLKIVRDIRRTWEGG